MMIGVEPLDVHVASIRAVKKLSEFHVGTCKTSLPIDEIVVGVEH